MYTLHNSQLVQQILLFQHDKPNTIANIALI